jgi:hypothetical protein
MQKINKETAHLSTDNYTIIKRKYFEQVVAPALASIQSNHKPIIRSYLIVGKKIRFRFYSKILCDNMILALDHHDKFEGDPELIIEVWDSKSTGQNMASPWSNPDYFKNITDSGHQTESGFLGVYLFGENTLQMYRRDKNIAYFWVRNDNELPDWVSAEPFRAILNWFMSSNGIHLVHGAAVGIKGRSVLLGARSGSGKSTTSLACLLDGMDYTGDDYVAINTAAQPRCYNLYNSVKVTSDSMKRFPELSEKIWNKETFQNEPGERKAVLFLSKLFDGRVAEEARLDAVLVPRLGKQTRIVPETKMATMLALAPTILFQLPLASSDKIAELKKIISRTPCYSLELGPEVRDIPRVIKEFLKERI